MHFRIPVAHHLSIAAASLVAGMLTLTGCVGTPTAGSARAVADLRAWLALPRDQRPPLSEQPFSRQALTAADEAGARRALWEDHAAYIRADRTDEMRAQLIEMGGLEMPFRTVSFGDTNRLPPAGRSLFISLHGGGGAPKGVNNRQWTNQVALARAYAPAEGLYLAPRAPTDTWNLWHEAHIDAFLARIIENLIVLENVSPDRVYVMGYSAGGDGVYQLAPRMADRWAAAAMMAGHPNDASPINLRNLPFALQVGALDAAFHRNEKAQEWGALLDALQHSDPGGYVHFTELHAGKAHWMELADKKAVPWMEKFTRNARPTRVVWRQDDVPHQQFYWLALPAEVAPKAGFQVEATRDGANIELKSSEPAEVRVRVDEAMIPADREIVVRSAGQVLFRGRVPRTIRVLADTLEERGDPSLVFSGEITVRVPRS